MHYHSIDAYSRAVLQLTHEFQVWLPNLGLATFVALSLQVKNLNNFAVLRTITTGLVPI